MSCPSAGNRIPAYTHSLGILDRESGTSFEIFIARHNLPWESCHIWVFLEARVIYDDEILVSWALFCQRNRMPPTRTKRDTPCCILITHTASKQPSAIYLSRDAQRSPPGYSQMSISPPCTILISSPRFD